MPRIFLDGDPIEAQLEDSVAGALLRAGVTTFTRSIKYHRPRGPFCFAGSCGQCLMRIDGVPSLPACRVRVAEGMRCERQNGPLGVENDLFRAADFLFPEGLDHHHLMVRSRLLGRVALEIARRHGPDAASCAWSSSSSSVRGPPGSRLPARPEPERC